MAWLNQNWPYLLLLLGVLAFLSWRGSMGCGIAGSSGRLGPHPAQGPDVDPVSGEPVWGDSAVVAMHRGHLYHFNSRENRDRFEATPDRFISGPVAPDGHAHRHGGHGRC